MRLRVLSDLHREIRPVDLPAVQADVVVLAGDIDRGARGVIWARQAFAGTPVLYVAGNHEYYGQRIGRLLEKLKDAARDSNATVLENASVELNAWRFFGATLWTDFDLLGDRQSAMLAAGNKERGMTDFRKIRRRDASRFQPKHSALMHAQSRLALTKFLTDGDPARSVVITHHAPSIRSIQAGRENDPISAAYASNLEPLILDRGPRLWIHGHIHEARDYQLGRTRVLNNSLGYQTTQNPESTGFRSDLVVELWPHLMSAPDALRQ